MTKLFFLAQSGQIMRVYATISPHWESIHFGHKSIPCNHYEQTIYRDEEAHALA